MNSLEKSVLSDREARTGERDFEGEEDEDGNNEANS